jgi:flagellar export protein FliJ
MKRFNFRLARLLRLRRMEEERAEVALAEATRGFDAADAAVEGLRVTHREAIGALHASIGDGRGASDWPARLADHIGRVEREMGVALRARASALIALDAARAVWETRRRDRRVLEELETKARAAHAEAAAKEEQSSLDESAGMRHALRGGEVAP